MSRSNGQEPVRKADVYPEEGVLAVGSHDVFLCGGGKQRRGLSGAHQANMLLTRCTLLMRMQTLC